MRNSTWKQHPRTRVWRGDAIAVRPGDEVVASLRGSLVVRAQEMDVPLTQAVFQRVQNAGENK